MRKRLSRAAILRVTIAFAAAGALAGVAASGHFGGTRAASPGAVRGLSALGVADGDALATPVTARPLVSAPDAVVNKGSATIGPGSVPATWAGDDVSADTAGKTDAECNAPASPPSNAGRCDDFFVTVNAAVRSGSFSVNVQLTPPEDYDLYIFDKDNELVGSSALGQQGAPNGLPEASSVTCPSADRSPYKVRVVYYQTLEDPLDLVYHATATYNDTGACPAAPNVSYVGGATADALTFAPSTLVSAHFLGVEPQVVMERTTAPGVPAGNPGGLDNNRIFIDWPLSSRSNIGQLSRSLDGGDSFRLLIDLACAPRSRPNCLTGGGGDTENDVNVKNGHVFFADQEVLANEAEATSLDHGDSFTFQSAITNGTSATDRQWLAGTDSSQSIAGQPIEAFFSYHVPPNAYVHQIPEATHLPAPQPAPQIPNAGQTGQIKVDNNPTSPGYGWIYYPYRGFIAGGSLQDGTNITTARSTNMQLPTDWHPTQVEPAGADSFPWVAIDSAGNAYVTFDTGGSVYWSYSLISDSRNNPALGGTPGSIWSLPAEITPPSITSAIFPEVTAGATPGTIGVTYLGTNENVGDPGAAEPNDRWRTYAAVITGANTNNATAYTGQVSHRVSHQGNICTHGTTCGLPPNPPTEDRSLADMIDIGGDVNGRLGVVFQDNFTESYQDNEATPDTSPFVYFAKQVSGPTLAGGTANVAVPTGARDDAAGDATWPNTSAGANLAALDLKRTSISLVGTNLVARLKLADASTPAMTGAITTYNAVVCAPPCAAERLQYIARFNSVDEAFHLSLEVLPNGTMRAFGGRLDANDGIVNPGSPTSVIANGYHTDPGFTVTPTITPGADGEIVLSAPVSQFGLASGSNLFSVTGIATAGPLEQNEVISSLGNPPQTAAYLMRTVDASPPFDTTLGAGPTGVTLRSLTASIPAGRSVVVRWRTGAESRLLGFNVYRLSGSKQVKLNRTLVVSKHRTVGGSYSLRDTLPQGIRAACYKLQSVQLGGGRRWLGTACAQRR